jgi:mannitol/fructose-specific phosphotransferase system IIA component (Ntr-type)
MPTSEASEWALSLADFTSPGLMIPALEGADAAAGIQELSAALQREGLIADLLQFYHAVLNREYLCHTVAAPGWAMPHAKAKGLSRPYFALGRWVPPRLWVKSAQPVSLVFLFAVPDTDARGYLTLISGVARLSKAPELVDQLLAAGDSFEMFNVLARVPLASRAAVA